LSPSPEYPEQSWCPWHASKPTCKTMLLSKTSSTTPWFHDMQSMIPRYWQHSDIPMFRGDELVQERRVSDVTPIVAFCPRASLTSSVDFVLTSFLACYSKTIAFPSHLIKSY
jgi:hypothetical protein